MALATLLAVLLPAAAQIPAAPARTSDDPVTGVWEGRARGDFPDIPPEGVPFSLRLEATAEDEALATLEFEGAPALAPAEATFDPESGELEFRGDLAGLTVDVQVVLAGEELTGSAAGLGMKVALSGTRTSRELTAVKPPEPPRARADLATLGADDWRSDLAFLAQTLPERHANAYHALGEQGWRQRVDALNGRLGGLSPAESAVALAQLVAAVGDAHTELALSGAPFDRFLPLQVTWFSDGWFVTAVDRRFEAALGCRVLRVGKASVEEAVAAVRSTFAAENDSWPRVKAPGKLAQPALLAALGVTADAAAIPLVVSGPGGEETSVTIDGPGEGQWLVAPDPALVAPPTWRRRTREAYWMEPLAEGRVLYLAYNRCAEDPARPMAAFMAEVLAALARPEVERLVIDLRHNSGGNSAVLGRFVPDFAKHPRLAAPGSLRVLIGATTYSSGMQNAHELRAGARARLYGEPTGGKPNSYGELRSFALPRSGLEVWHSTKLFRMLESDPPAVEPDVVVTLSSEEHFAGADPVLERALED